MTAPRVELELRKLAHTLDVPVERLGMLSPLSAQDVRALRTQVSQALFEADRASFSRVAALSRTIPVAVSAKLSELALPPLLAARTAELIEPRRAVELVARLSERYLADVSAVMDPARAPEVVAAIPPERISRVAAELARREEWIVIGGFIDTVTAEGLAAAVACFDGEQLLRIGFVVDDDQRLGQVAHLLTDAQIDAMVQAAARESLWSELADLVRRLEADRRERLARHLAHAADDVRAAYAQAAASGELDPSTATALGVDAA